MYNIIDLKYYRKDKLVYIFYNNSDQCIFSFDSRHFIGYQPHFNTNIDNFDKLQSFKVVHKLDIKIILGEIIIPDYDYYICYKGHIYDRLIKKGILNADNFKK